jgi:hypothetical protein
LAQDLAVDKKNMKKLLLLLIALITLTNVSYASFPVADTLNVKQDSLQTETVEQYHIRMQRLGFNLDDCKCELCVSKNLHLVKVNNEIPFKTSIFSFEVGLGTVHAPNLLNLNYEYHFDKNFSWHFSVGLPSFTTGFTISNQRNSQYSFIIGNIMGEEYCLRYAWVKQKGISKKLFWCYGVQVPIIMFDNNGIESLMSTAGSGDAALFLPLPIINLKYQL